MNDILDKISKLIERIEDRKDLISKDNAIQIMEYLIVELSEDRILLENMKSCIKRYWSYGNPELTESFYELLSFYDIIDNDKKILDKKTILEKKGGMLVRKKIVLKNKSKILELLN